MGAGAAAGDFAAVRAVLAVPFVFAAVPVPVTFAAARGLVGVALATLVLVAVPVVLVVARLVGEGVAFVAAGAAAFAGRGALAAAAAVVPAGLFAVRLVGGPAAAWPIAAPLRPGETPPVGMNLSGGLSTGSGVELRPGSEGPAANPR
ncbi:MAG TPA: hypothetical protein VL337_16375 [Acidimicrobiales bacterium]|nr:hypothetical protein [Acidimicrobiales bacterium]